MPVTGFPRARTDFVRSAVRSRCYSVPHRCATLLWFYAAPRVRWLSVEAAATYESVHGCLLIWPRERHRCYVSVKSFPTCAFPTARHGHRGARARRCTVGFDHPSRRVPSQRHPAGFLSGCRQRHAPARETPRRPSRHLADDAPVARYRPTLGGSRRRHSPGAARLKQQLLNPISYSASEGKPA